VTKIGCRPVVVGRAEIRFLGKRRFAPTPTIEMKTETEC